MTDLQVLLRRKKRIKRQRLIQIKPKTIKAFFATMFDNKEWINKINHYIDTHFDDSNTVKSQIICCIAAIVRAQASSDGGKFGDSYWESGELHDLVDYCRIPCQNGYADKMPNINLAINIIEKHPEVKKIVNYKVDCEQDIVYFEIKFPHEYAIKDVDYYQQASKQNLRQVSFHYLGDYEGLPDVGRCQGEVDTIEWDRQLGGSRKTCLDAIKAFPEIQPYLNMSPRPIYKDYENHHLKNNTIHKLNKQRGIQYDEYDEYEDYDEEPSLQNFARAVRKYFDVADCTVVNIGPISQEAQLALYEQAKEACTQQRKNQQDQSVEYEPRW